MQRIEICGNIASGKTTLATLLDGVGWHVVYEHMEQNPFLNSFYETRGKIALNYDFETECTCLLMHHSWIKAGLAETHSQGVQEIIVSDFSLLQDLSYAKANLGTGDLGTFELLYQRCRSELSEPDLLIFLTCDERTLLERIRKRGRPAEQSIDEAYLRRIESTLAEEVATFHDVLTVDTGEERLLGEGFAEILASLQGGFSSAGGKANEERRRFCSQQSGCS